MRKIDVVCAVIRNEDGKLFIAKRKSKVANGIWEFPGGKVEKGETKDEACIREIKEELELDIVLDGFLMTLEDKTFDPIVVVSAYLAHMKSGEIQLHAHQEGVWVAPADLYRYHFQDADKKLLDKLQKDIPGVS